MASTVVAVGTGSLRLSAYDVHRAPIPVDSRPGRVVELAAEELLADVTCPICLSVLKDTQTPLDCTHRFCKTCIEQSLRKNQNRCPSCREKVPTKRSLRADANFDRLIGILCGGDVQAFEDTYLKQDLQPQLLRDIAKEAQYMRDLAMLQRDSARRQRKRMRHEDGEGEEDEEETDDDDDQEEEDGDDDRDEDDDGRSSHASSSDSSSNNSHDDEEARPRSLNNATPHSSDSGNEESSNIRRSAGNNNSKGYVRFILRQHPSDSATAATLVPSILKTREYIRTPQSVKVSVLRTYIARQFAAVGALPSSSKHASRLPPIQLVTHDERDNVHTPQEHDTLEDFLRVAKNKPLPVVYFSLVLNE